MSLGDKEFTLKEATKLFFTITDILGRKVYQSSAMYYDGKRSISIDLGKELSGFYIFKCSNGNAIYQSKLLHL